MFVIYVAFISGVLVYSGILLSGILVPDFSADDTYEGFAPEPMEPQYELVLVLVLLSMSQIGMRFAFRRFVPIPEKIDSGSYANYAQNLMIVQLACLEAIGIFGICSIFFGLATLHALGFCIVALVFLLHYFGEFQKMANNYLDLVDSERAVAA